VVGVGGGWFGGALVGPWWSFGAEARRGLGTNVRPCAPSKGAKDHPNMGERLLPQCV
jgi:hypothetical protein